MKTHIKVSLAIIFVMLVSSVFADNGNSWSWNWTWLQDQDRTQDQDKLQDCTWDCDQLKLQDQDKTQDQDKLQDCTWDCDQLKDQDRIKDRLHILDTSKLYREDMKNNKNIFNTQFWTETWSFANLNEWVKMEIRNINQEYNNQFEEIKNLYREKINSAILLENKEQLREELKIKLQDMAMIHYQDLEESVWSDENALAWVKARQELAIKNKELIEENNALRNEFNYERKNQISYFKEKFDSQLWSNIGKISQNNHEKLEQLLTKIDSFMVKYETNTNLSKMAKDKILSQLTALKELIEDSLDIEEIIM